MATIKEFQTFDFRVAEVLSAELHPNADKLLVLKVKVGDTEKQIVAGIKSTYTPDELKGKKIVVVNNLEPATLRGVESQGMLLAASSGDQVVLVSPERDVPSGAQVR